MFSDAISGANEGFEYAHERRVELSDLAEGVLALTAAGTNPVALDNGKNSRKRLRSKTMRRSILLTIISVATFAFAACTPETKPVNVAPVSTPVTTPASSPVASPASSPTGSPAATDTTGKPTETAFVGKWNGPEGTFLNITKKGEKFELEIKNLDPASKKYEGTLKDGVIEFTRDGKPATAKPANGDETGMKWLAGKKNCLVITKNSEGFCKD
jgi:hypothetical protein